MACANEQVFGLTISPNFVTVMDVSTVKVILALAEIRGVPENHEENSNSYVTEDKEAHHEVLLHVPQAMNGSEDTLTTPGAEHKKNVALELRKSSASSRPDYFGALSCTLNCWKLDLSSTSHICASTGRSMTVSWSSWVCA